MYIFDTNNKNWFYTNSGWEKIKNYGFRAAEFREKYWCEKRDNI